MKHDEHWDAGALGCSQLIFHLHVRLTKMEPGQTLELTTSDEGAPVDLPAWCRTTGHTLVSADHPVYVIQRRAG